MISRKDWNNLPELTRERAAKLVFFHMGDKFQKEMSAEWHHNNDTWHDMLFSHLYWVVPQKELKVVMKLTVH